MVAEGSQLRGCVKHPGVVFLASQDLVGTQCAALPAKECGFCHSG